MENVAVVKTDLKNIKKLNSGKVRDMYDLGEHLLIVTTDRISAFDVIMQEGIPDKGRILTKISIFWFDLLKDVVENHLVSTDIKDVPNLTAEEKIMLEGRIMIVRKAKVFPVECIARGYIAGSGWSDYQKTGTICGHQLPEGLQLSDKLPGIIFTPSTKAEAGHDQNISIKEAETIIGKENITSLENLAISLYKNAAEYAITKGIIIADTKFEFGVYNDRIIVVDEVLSPDSSRFWPAQKYKVGVAQDSFDKQYLRDYLETCDWDKTAPAPNLPDEVIKNTRAKYLNAFELLTGNKFE